MSKLSRVLLRAVVASAVGAALALSTVTAASATVPPSIGTDGDWQYLTNWNTEQSNQEQPYFWGPMSLQIGPEGTVFGQGHQMAYPSQSVLEFDPATGAVITTFFDPSLKDSVDAVVGFHVDTDGVWVTYSNFIVHYDRNGVLLGQFTLSKQYPAYYENSVGLVEDSTGSLFGFGFGPGPDYDQEIIRFDPQTSSFTLTPISVPGGLTTEGQLAITADDQLLFVDFEGQVVSMATDGTGYTVLAPSSAQPTDVYMKSLTIASDGSIYVVASDGSVWHLVDGAYTPVIATADHPAAYTPYDIHGIAVDLERGRLYVGGIFANDGGDTWEFGANVFQMLVSPSLTASAVEVCPGAPVTLPIAASGNPAVSWFELTAGTLPAGISLDPLTGTIAGTPQQSGSYPVTVTGYNGVSPAQATTTQNSVAVTLTVGGTTCAVAAQPALANTGVALSGTPTALGALAAALILLGLAFAVYRRTRRATR